MTQQLINIGSSANKGDGDAIRTAFDKVNDNFTELYLAVVDNDNAITVQSVKGDVIGQDSTVIVNASTNTFNGDLTGSVFADDSSLLVDAVNAIIPAAVVSGTLTNDLTGNVTGNTTGYHTGDVLGSVFADDSTLLVDAVNGLIPTGIIDGTISNNIDTASLRTSEDKIALGNAAGGLNQSQYGIGIGFGAGAGNQEDKAISIGHRAGQVSQGASAVAIGNFAGNTVQGQNAVALGSQAGENNQASNSVVINATGSVLENTTASSLVIKPIRSATMTTILGYDATSGEVTHNATIPGYINITDLKTLVAASADFADYQTRIAAL